MLLEQAMFYDLAIKNEGWPCFLNFHNLHTIIKSANNKEKSLTLIYEVIICTIITGEKLTNFRSGRSFEGKIVFLIKKCKNRTKMVL